MDHHFERRVRLDQEPEYKNLYEWSLQEFDADDRKTTRDQIPWQHNSFFTCHEMRLIDSIGIEKDYRLNEEDRKTEIRERRYIYGSLTPGHPKDHAWLDHTSYSMFGTEREISKFDLRIQRMLDREKQEYCQAWGSVSYTSEVDFRDETEDDCIVFYLFVNAETFARYESLIAASAVDEATFRVSGVAGFYSDWSPSISTSSIKVLTGHKEHEVDIPEGCMIDPPRLREVDEAELILNRIIRLASATPVPSEDDDIMGADDGDLAVSPDEVSRAQAAKQTSALTKSVKLLSSLRIVAWVIAGLLLLAIVT